MSNSQQICDFFRKMADGSLINMNAQNLETSKDGRVEIERTKERKIVINDFGVGLPPLAQG